MLVLCLTWLLWLPYDSGRTVSAIPIAVAASPDIKDSLLHRICDEADVIWRPAGFRFDWHRLTSDGASSGSALYITVGDRSSDAAHGKALGWITFDAESPNRSIYLSRSAAENLLEHTPGLNTATPLFKEILIGRALGRALAHELGHYFLRSKRHTAAGLMRAAWTSNEFFAVRREGFELTPAQQAVALGPWLGEIEDHGSLDVAVSR